MYGRYPRRRKPTQPPPPLPEAMLDEFRDRPFGSVGETSVVRPAEPPPPTPQPLQIEEPPWKNGLDGVGLVPEPLPPPERPSALQELMADQPFDPPPPGPIEKLEPLVRPVPPPWPETERFAEKLAREREELGVDEELPATRPPIRREST